MAQNSNPIEQIHLTFSPNPFTDVININGFTLAVDQHITIKVYDVAGRLVKRLYDGEINKSIAIKWVGVDGTGRTVPPGIYFIELTNADAKTKVCQKLIRAE